MKIVKGDLIRLAQQGEFDVIVHGCNCFCNMGAGIAKQIKKSFGGAYKADLKTRHGDKRKLGTYSYDYMPMADVIVVNAYTQFSYGGGKRNADYKAIESVFHKIKNDFPGMKIGYPMIGAGLAGGDWDVISEIIDRCLEGEDHTLVEFSQESAQ